MLVALNRASLLQTFESVYDLFLQNIFQFANVSFHRSDWQKTSHFRWRCIGRRKNISALFTVKSSQKSVGTGILLWINLMNEILFTEFQPISPYLAKQMEESTAQNTNSTTYQSENQFLLSSSSLVLFVLIYVRRIFRKSFLITIWKDRRNMDVKL